MKRARRARASMAPGVVVRRDDDGELLSDDLVASNSANDISSASANAAATDAAYDPWCPWIDVTLQLQYMVDDSRLYLQAASKAGLLGFYDPVPLIRYFFSLLLFYQFIYIPFV